MATKTSKAVKGSKAAKGSKVTAPVFATASGRVTAASTLRGLRAQFVALMAKSPKQGAAHKTLAAKIATAEDAVFAHRVARTKRPAKAGRVATRLGLTGVERLLPTV